MGASLSLLVARCSRLAARRFGPPKGGHYVLRLLVLAALASAFRLAVPTMAQQRAISDKPETPFKLATFEAGGKIRVGLVLSTGVLDIAGANDALVKSAGVAAMRIPTEMRELVESYDRVKPRLCVSGHIHEGHGQWERHGTILANVTHVDRAYRPLHEAMVFDL